MNKKPKPNIPLALRLMLAMLALVTGMIGLSVFLNNTFLERYYTYRKQQQILENFSILDQASRDRSLYSDDFDETFERMCLNGNYSIMISERLTGVLLRGYFGNNRKDAMDEMLDLLTRTDDRRQKIILEEEDFVISIQNNKRMGGDQMVLLGQLAGGENVYMRTAVRSLTESAAITNRFFLYTGILTLLISCLVIYLISRSISRPLQKLQMLSEQMSQLDFEAKYQPRKSDPREIAELGHHMNEMSETIEHTVSELKSANLELKKDIARKQEIDDMRREFLSNVSHELKTPLALIQGYAEGLQECINDDAESREFYCEVIQDETEKMNRMVQKLLTLNNLEFGNEQPVMERFDLTELVSSVIDSASLLAKQDGIRIIFHPDQPCQVWGDAFRFEEVVTNYISNAIHHCEGEPREIHVAFEERDGQIRFKVFNYGRNIPEEEVEKIWIKFYKVDKARTREYGGSGIGLSIVKAIMDSMQQQCGVRNCKGGVEFWAELEKA